jgi:hypothetical protein
MNNSLVTPVPTVDQLSAACAIACATPFFAQHDQKLKRLRLGYAKLRQNGMGLAPMMRLMVEEMREDLRQRLPLRRATKRPVGARLFEIRIAKPLHKTHKPCIFGLPCAAQRLHIIE